MTYPDDILDNIKSRLSILAVVGRYIKLTITGNTGKGICPFHQEKTPSFTVTEKHGTFKCFGCGKAGNVFQFLQQLESRNFPDVVKQLAAEAGMELPDHAGNDDSYIPPPRLPKRKDDNFIPADTRTPVDKWREQAEKLVEKSHAALLENKEQLDWLKARGINIETVKRFKLGWNGSNYFRSRQAWGLKDVFKENGKAKKLWVPPGLVIPIYLNGTIDRVTVRRPEGEPRYFNIPGSGNALLIVPAFRPGVFVAIVVETYLDAMLISQEAGDITGVIALGSAQSKPEAAAFPFLEASACILVALDFDGAGAKAWQWWSKTFSPAKRWPSPAGKDPGDYVKDHKGNVRAWIIAGLPPGLRSGAPSRPAINSDEYRPAENGDGGSTSPHSNASLYKQTTRDGQEVYITSDPEIYLELSRKKEMVFSPAEINKVKTAVGEGDPDDAAWIFPGIKEIFGGGHIQTVKDLTIKE